jgi:PAS domain S-box-containing protein
MSAPASRSFLSGGGVTGEIMRSIDWAQTPVGPIETWSISLRTAVGILLHSRHPMFLWWGPELTQFYNDAYLPSFGVEKHPAAMGGRGRETWPEIWSIIGPKIDDVMSRGESTWDEDALVPILRNGKIEDVYWTYGYSPVFDDAGDVGGVLVVCTETTERVLAAQREQVALAEAELERSRILRLFAEAPAGICIVRGPGLVIEFTNEEYCHLVGRSELVGKQLLEALPELKEQGVDERLRDVMRSGETFIGRESRVANDGGVPGPRERFFTFIWSPLREPNGVVDSVSMFAFDVTDQVIARRKAEDLAVQLERAVVSEHTARQTAEVANQAKDDFLATVSHELRTPLTAMLGWARMLIDGKISPSKREHALTVIERNAVAQARLIDDLLDVSRIIAGNMRLHFAAVDIARVVESAIDSVRPALDAKSIELHTAMGPVMSSVVGDPNRLQQVVWNLLVNAAKFTHKGGRVQVTLKCHTLHVELRIDDNGRGISADFLPRVFDRFRQAETGHSRSPGGLGLGLAISRHLVELHRGSLDAYSEGEGRGSSFVLTLPLAPVVKAPIPRSTTSGEPDFEDRKELEGLRVLVVDDEQDARERTTSIL